MSKAKKVEAMPMQFNCLAPEELLMDERLVGSPEASRGGPEKSEKSCHKSRHKKQTF